MILTHFVARFYDLVLLGQQEPGGAGMLQQFMLPFIVVAFMYYFMVVRPEKANREKHEDLLGNLKKNDHIVTTGGIHGTVVNADKGSPKVVIRIDENTNTKIHVQRSSIARVVTESDTAESTAS